VKRPALTQRRTFAATNSAKESQKACTGIWERHSFIQYSLSANEAVLSADGALVRRHR